MAVSAPVVFLALVLGTAGVLATLAVLVRLERRGRSDVAVLAVLTLVVVDALLYPVYGTTTGLLSFGVGGGTVSLAAALAVCAVLVKLVVPRPGRPVAVSAGLWAAFFLWILGAGVRGVLAGNDAFTAVSQALIVLHVGVVGLLAADAPVDRLTTGLERLAAVFAPVLVVVGLVDLAGMTTTLSLPLLPDVTLGAVGADAATALVALGALSVVIGLAQRTGRGVPLVCGAVLLCAPLVTDQRAAWIGTAVTVVVLAGGVLVARRSAPAGRAGRSRRDDVVGLRTPEALAATAVVGLAAVGVLLWSAMTGRTTGFVAYVTGIFTSVGNQQSSRSRENQWSSAAGTAAEHPLIGSGLGTGYRYFEEGSRELVHSVITHNIVLDVALRGGAVAVLLLLLALGSTVLTALTVLTGPASWRARAVALGATAALAGLVTKGMVESILEKERLAILLGVCLGLVHAAWAASRRPPVDALPREQAPSAGVAGPGPAETSRTHRPHPTELSPEAGRPSLGTPAPRSDHTTTRSMN